MRQVYRSIVGIVLVGMLAEQALAQPLSFLDTPNVIVPDNDAAGVATDISVTVTFPITSVNVMLRLNHLDTGQLKVELEHVDTTTKITLVEIIGGGLPGTGEDNARLWGTVHDSALLPVDLAESAHPAPSSIEGSFGPDTALSAFDGESTLGTWRLTVSDLVALDVGTLAAWSISFNSPWTDMGLGLPGFSDTSHLEATGTLTAFSPYTVSVTGAEKFTPGLLFIDQTMLPYPFPFKGGFFGPNPGTIIAIATDGLGEWSVSGTFPPFVPPGVEFYMQYWYQDLFMLFFVASTNTISAVTP